MLVPVSRICLPSHLRSLRHRTGMSTEEVVMIPKGQCRDLLSRPRVATGHLRQLGASSAAITWVEKPKLRLGNRQSCHKRTYHAGLQVVLGCCSPDGSQLARHQFVPVLHLHLHHVGVRAHGH